MSISRSHIPPLEVRERAACMCVHGASCSEFAPGHAVHLIHARLVSATPSEWVDAIVESVDTAEATLVVRALDGTTLELWNAAGASAAVEPGLPVAVHGRYPVLAVGARLFNVARLG